MMFSTSSLLLLLSLTATLISAAPATDPVASNLRDAGKLLSPGLSKFDYASLRGDMTPAQEARLREIMSREATDDVKRRELMRVNAAAPSLPTLGAGEVEALRDFGQFSAVAYCATGSNLGNWACGKACNARVRSARFTNLLSGEDTLGYVAIRPNQGQIVVSFRGSNNAGNWADNLNLIRTNYPYGRLPGSDGASVHQGFVDAYRPVRSATQNALRNAVSANPGFQVVFTGHSLGGALATLAATDAIGAGIVSANRVRLTTFGAPRVGNNNFANMVTRLGLAGLDRVVEGNDLVPHIPPAFAGFLHSAGEKYVLDGRAYVCGGLEDGKCSNSRVPFLSIGAHGEFFGQRDFFGKSGC
ncbi:Alpha/Beta hydrolase protein [Catenaria anguillulae PL171]|uniref:Alpha/Beta hydrolase protein n=1 Tax=Catenaria anguillulae PL171 TaxID=765915 RepID=A0A1Y2HSS0_9FUNG|nr:Alpha/Beta hydrolase protein [Catenaria anguillulae PL171]